MKTKNILKNLSVFLLSIAFILFIYLIYSMKVYTPTLENKVNEYKPEVIKVNYEPKLNLKKVAFSDLKGFKQDELVDGYKAMVRSCNKIIESPKDRIVKKIYFNQACKAIKDIKIVSNKNIRKVLTKYFEPFQVLDKDGKDEGTITGYYSVKLNGSYEKTDVYKYPLYKLPDDLMTVDLSNFVNCTKCTFVARVDSKNKKIVPYYTNSEITKGKLDKKEVLLWVDNPVTATIMHIQGSGVVVLPDGKEVKINYAGNNGRNFYGIGWILKSLDLLENGKSSMQDVKDWLLNNPEKSEDLMTRNPRYIFFKKAKKNKGPIGSLGVELTAGRSIAVDNDNIPLGMFMWLDTTAPDGKKLQRFVSAQDTGAAIKGMIRADYYFGVGDEAFANAGKMKAKGSYYLILPKEQLF